MEFKKFNDINASKKFRNHFHYICLYYRHTHYGISQRQNMFRVYVIHSNYARLHNFFFFMMDCGENGYLHSKMWAKMTEKCPGWKKIEKLTIGVGGGWTIIRDSKETTSFGVNNLTFPYMFVFI